MKKALFVTLLCTILFLSNTGPIIQSALGKSHNNDSKWQLIDFLNSLTCRRNLDDIPEKQTGQITGYEPTSDRNDPESNLEMSSVIEATSKLVSEPTASVTAYGSLTVYVKNANGAYVPGAKVVRYDTSWTKIDEMTTDSSGKAYWSSVVIATYYIEVYYPSPAALGYSEFWGSDTISMTGSTTFYFTRHTQWVYDVKINGQGLGTVVVNPGDQIHVDVTVKNMEAGSPSKDVMTTVILDRDKSSPYDLNQDRGPVSISYNGYGSFGWDYYPSSPGVYYIYIIVRGYYNSQYIVTDQYNWANAFSVNQPKGKLYVEVTNNDDDSHRVNIYVDSAYWGYIDVSPGYITTSVDKDVDAGYHIVEIRWHDDDSAQDYSKSLNQYVGGNQRIKYGYTLDRYLTAVYVYVKNAGGAAEQDATVVRYDTNWNRKDQAVTDANGLAYWPSTEDGTFNYEVYNYYNELWGDFSLSVGNRGPVSYTFTRFMPLAYEITTSKAGINLGEPITVTVKVRNPSAISRSIRVKVLVDMSKSSPWDWESGYQQTTLASGATISFDFTWTPTSTGTYYVYTTVETYLTGPAKWVLTDHWEWSPSFVVNPAKGKLYVTITNNDDDAHTVNIDVGGTYWTSVTVPPGGTVSSADKEVDAGNYQVTIRWHDDDSNQDYSKSLTKYVDSAQRVQYSLILDKYLTPLSIYVHNQQGNAEDSATVVRYDANWNPIDSQKTDSSGLAYWPSVDDGTFNFEVYNYYNELWGDFSLVVGNKGPITYIFTRFMPYAYEITLSKDKITIGETITVTVNVINPSAISRTVRVRIIIDRDKSSPWDWESGTQQTSIASGGSSAFSFTWAPDEAGIYYVWTTIETYLTGPTKWVLTDHWEWYPYFTLQMPDLVVLSVWIEPSTPTSGQPFTLKATIMNQGDGDAVGVFYTMLSVDNLYCHSDVKAINGLSAGSMVEVVWMGIVDRHINLQLSPAGSHSLMVTVDSGNIVVEGNEDNNDATIGVTVREAKWTAMFYLAGDNDLEGFVDDILGKLRRVGSSADVSIIAIIDKRADGDSAIYYVIQQQYPYDPNAYVVIKDGFEANMGDPNALRDFLLQSKTFAAEHYWLTIADHGNSTHAPQVEETPNDALSIVEIGQALKNADIKIDLLFMDACLMGTVEFAYEIKDYVSILVASEELGLGIHGWGSILSDAGPFAGSSNDVLNVLLSNPSMSPYTLASHIVDCFGTWASGWVDWYTYSAIDLTACADFVSSFNELATKLKSKDGLFKVEIQNVLLDTEHYTIIKSGSTWVDRTIDLYNFTSFIYSRIDDPEIKQAALKIINSYFTVVLSMQNGPSHRNSYGLSVHFPVSSSTYDWLKSFYSTTAFAKDTMWDEFLENHLTLGNINVEVIYPGDGGVQPLGYQVFDVNWNYLSEGSSDSYKFKICDLSEGIYNICVYQQGIFIGSAENVKVNQGQEVNTFITTHTKVTLNIQILCQDNSLYLSTVTVWIYNHAGDSVYTGTTDTSGQISFNVWPTTKPGEYYKVQVESPYQQQTDSRYIFGKWSDGDEANPKILTITSSVTLTANYRVQYYLTVNSPYANTNGFGWYNKGEYAYAGLDVGTISGGSGILYVFIHWSGDASGTNYADSNPILIDQPKVANANWKTMYWLTVTSNPVNVDNPRASGWYDEGTTQTIQCDSPALDSTGKQYVFTQWSGDASGTSTSATVYMNGPKMAIANYQLQIIQRKLAVSSAHDSPNPSNGDHYYNDNSQVTCSITSPVTEGSTVWTCTGWIGTGSVPSSGSGTTVTFTITQDSSITWNWQPLPPPPPLGFEDGFESGNFNAWTGTSTSSGETATITNSLAHHGTYSAMFTSNGGSGAEMAYCYKTISSASELYARGYFRVATSGIVDEADRFYFIVFKAGTEKVAFAGWRRTSGAVMWSLIIRQGSGWVKASSVASPSLNQWYCIELHWKKDASTGFGEMWVDGVLVCSITGKNTAYFGEVNRVDFGLAEIMYCGATTVYGDCAKIAATYIGPEEAPPPPPSGFEDGFESGNFNAWTGVGTSTGETAEVVNTLPHHGAYSAMFISNGGSSSEMAYCYETITSTTGLYVRAYFRVTSSGIFDEADRFFFLVFKAGSEKVAFAGWRRTGGIVKWCLIVRHGSGWVYTVYAASPSLNQWYCVELHWKKDAAVGLGELWIDGTLVCSITGKNTAYYGDVNRVDFGLAEVMYCGATTVYGDCAKISDAYIGPEEVPPPPPSGFEDGFESGSFSEWTDTSSSSGETATVTSALAHHGTYSAMFTSNGNGGAEMAYCYKTIPSATELYARGYFYVSVSGIVDEADRFFFIVFKAGTEKVAFAGWRKTAGVVTWCLIIRHGSGWVKATSAASPLLNEWYCVELHWKKDAAAGLGELWVDGVLVCSITGKNTAYYGDVNRVDFGLAEIMQCGPTQVYGDCCIIANTYIGTTATSFLDSLFAEECKRIKSR